MNQWRAEQLIVGAIYELAKAEGWDPVIDENAPFDVEAHGPNPWYRVTMLPGRPVYREIGRGSKKRQVGIVQFDVFVPVGSYKGYAKTVAQKVIDAFPSKRVVSGSESGEAVRIRESWYGARGSGQVGDAGSGEWHHVPVSIAWLADLADDYDE